MKYSEELYVDSGFYGLDEDLKCHKEKVVKCRKEHKCVNCGKVIKAGEHALYENGFYSGEPVSAYICLSCIEEWLEESGQVESEVAGNE